MSVSFCVWNFHIYGCSWQAYVLNHICPTTTWSKYSRLFLPFPSTKELSKVTGYSARFSHFAPNQHHLYLLVISVALTLSSLPTFLSKPLVYYLSTLVLIRGRSSFQYNDGKKNTFCQLSVSLKYFWKFCVWTTKDN